MITPLMAKLNEARKYSPEKFIFVSSVAPVAKPWPLALLPLKLLAKESDRGAGDIIARTIGPIGGNAFKKWYKTLFGKDCGCGARQEVLNARWSLEVGRPA